VINQLFTFSSTIERLRQGPLSEHLDAYAAAVGEQGYAPDSIKQQIVVIADFSRWLKKKQIAVQVLDSKAVDRFLRLRRWQQGVRRGDPKTLQRLLTMLRQIGVVKHQPPVVDTAHSRIVAEFQRYPLQERGLSPLTLLNYVPVVEQLLAERFHNSGTPELLGAAAKRLEKRWEGLNRHRICGAGAVFGFCETRRC
jgi:hypothetical protein